MPRAARKQTLVQASPRRRKGSADGSLLVATDFSPASRRAFDAAAALAQDLGVGLVLVHASGKGRAASKVRKGLRRRGEPQDYARDLAAWAEAGRTAGVPVTTVDEPGEPADVILQAAKDNACAVVVLAASGKGMARTLLVGSTAREVLRRSRSPVLIVPHRLGKADRPGKKAHGTPAGRTFVVGLDLSPASEAAYDAALGLARDLDAAIRIVHVVQLPLPTTGVPMEASLPVELLDRLEQEGAAALVDQAAKARAFKVQVEAVLHLGHPTWTLLADAKQAGASLIVVGSHGKSLGRQFFLGSIAQSLAQLADRPVLIVPDPDAKADPGTWTR